MAPDIYYPLLFPLEFRARLESIYEEPKAHNTSGISWIRAREFAMGPKDDKSKAKFLGNPQPSDVIQVPGWIPNFSKCRI